jgi:hypothetical protein
MAEATKEEVMLMSSKLRKNFDALNVNWLMIQSHFMTGLTKMERTDYFNKLDKINSAIVEANNFIVGKI